MYSPVVEILDAIRHRTDNTSRKDIAGQVSVSWGTMCSLIEQLIAQGVIVAGKSKPVVRGRPSIPLEIISDSMFWCGIDIGSSSTKIIFCDLAFKLCYQWREPTEFYTTQARFSEWLQSIFETAKQRSGIEPSRLRGIGISVSGNVNSVDGLIVSGGNFGMMYGENIPVRELSVKLGVPCFAINTQMAAVCAEYRFGKYAGSPDIVNIGLGVGIGSGVISNRTLLISHPKYQIGYIGHMLMPDNPYRCHNTSCGFVGCLEAFSGGNSLAKIASELYPDRPEFHCAAGLDHAAAAGDRDAVALLDKAASYDAVGIASMIQLYSPEVVIFSGGQCRQDGFLYQKIQNKLQQIIPPERRNYQVDLTTLGEYQAALGVARLAYEKLVAV